MDAEAINDIAKRVNPEDGDIDKQIDDMLKKNPSLQESESWNGATREQINAVRGEIVEERVERSVRFKGNNRMFIKAEDGNFRRVKENEEILVSESSGDVYIKDQNNNIRKVNDK